MNDEWEIEQFRRQGREFVVYHAYDQDHGEPWKECDGHGPVSEWRHHDPYEKPRKAPGELVLCTDRNSARFYDFAAAVKLARKDGWGAHTLQCSIASYGDGRRVPCDCGADSLTPGERAAKAAMQDFEFLRSWCANEWHYVGVIVRCQGKTASLWGIESNAYAYLEEVSRELAVDICREFTVERRAARDAAHRAVQARAFL